MIRPADLLAALLASAPAALAAAPALAVPGGAIGTLGIGTYACELPGDASGPVGLRRPEWDFTVIGASSYRAGGLTGSYLLTGDLVTMTSGPRAGLRFRRETRGLLRLADGPKAPARLRCVLLRDDAG